MSRLCNVLYNTKFSLPICCPLPGPSPAAALAGIEISPTLLQAHLQGLSRLLPAGRSPLLPPLLSFSHRYLSWLAPPVTPHPRAELEEPAAVASTKASIGDSPLTIAKAVRKRWVFVASNEARNERHTAQHIADRADVKAGLVADSIGTPLHCITECGVMLIGSKVLK